MTRRLTNAEMQLNEMLNNNVDSFESYFESEHADAPIAAPQTVAGAGSPRVSKMKGNPLFSAQFDIQFILKYFTIVTATGVATEVAAAALNAGLKTKLPLFLFGNSDFASGYKKLREQFPLSGGWSYGNPIVYGRDETPANWDATITNQLLLGDLVIPVTSALPGAGTTTLGLSIVRCNQVAYGTLLDALNSDRFVMNMIRYVLDDATKTAQFSQNINFCKQSLFGKFNLDYLSPNSYKKPEQYQNGIIDVPAGWGIDKQKALASFVNYDCVGMTWSIFVNMISKVEA
jgi:hypothetical protein